MSSKQGILISNKLFFRYCQLSLPGGSIKSSGFRMPFEYAFEVATVLLVFQLDAGLGCVDADWWYSFDYPGCSVCPNSNTYLKGLWRSEQAPGDERIGRIELGRCCQAYDQAYANQPVTCSSANWVSTLDW